MPIHSSGPPTHSMPVLALPAIAAWALAGLLSAHTVGAAVTDFANPAVAMSGDAIIASGSCIARYTTTLDDGSKPVVSIGRLVARHCAREISRAAALAAWMAGKPEDFAENLRYTQQDLTTATVLRHRAVKRPRAD